VPSGEQGAPAWAEVLLPPAATAVAVEGGGSTVVLVAAGMETVADKVVPAAAGVSSATGCFSGVVETSVPFPPPAVPPVVAFPAAALADPPVVVNMTF
jgi:hypothetical protein